LVHSAFWLLCTCFFFRLELSGASVAWLLSFLAATCGAYGLFVFRQAVWPVIGCTLPLSALYASRVVSHYLSVRREKRFIRQAFSTYVSPELVSQLIRERKSLHLGGEETEITAFFSDIQGFTTISEKLSPRELVALLNDYLTEMTDILLKYGGTVDKFEGDAIVAFFGAPTQLPTHADVACQCAMAMQDRLGQLKEAWAVQERPELHTRIGLCTGLAVVGNMGSKNRLDYTMMGDTPNTASRLEGANKVYGTRILVCDSTAKASPSIQFREVDSVRLKGKKNAVSLYEPIATADKMNPQDDQRLKAYQKALRAYRHGEWQTAVDGFSRCLVLDPQDGPSRVMKARCELFSRNPPLSWEGVFSLTDK
jgi:adenylate cyclase